MGFRTVFLALPAGVEDSALDRAAIICEGLGAHLGVLLLGIAPPPPSSPYGVVSNDIWTGEIDAGQMSVQKDAERLRARLGALGLSHTVDWQYVDRGTVPSLAARHARYADLTLIAPAAVGTEAPRGWVINGALFESGRPILILPGEGSGSRFPAVRQAVIAWDASVEAAKAVRDALELLVDAEAVHAVLIDPVPSFEGHGPEPGADLAAYLGRHGIAATVHKLPREGREVADVLLRCAADFDADLLVMGGFGHSRLRQRIFGGTTTRIMKETRVPVLMAH